MKKRGGNRAELLQVVCPEMPDSVAQWIGCFFLVASDADRCPAISLLGIITVR